MEKELVVERPVNFNKVVKGLLEAEKNGEEVYYVWNGVTLHSKGITEEKIIQQVFRMSKEEYDEMERKANEAREKQRQAAEARILANYDTWIERGNEIIYPERQEDWKKCVDTRSRDIYNGEDLDAALVIMEALDKGATNEEVEELFKKQGHSGVSSAMVRNIVLHFSKQGPRFYRETAPYVNSEVDEIIKGIEEENRLFEENKKEVTK